MSYVADDFEAIRKAMEKLQGKELILEHNYLVGGWARSGWIGEDGNVVAAYFNCTANAGGKCPRDVGYQCLKNKHCTPGG
jgi:hypothetical protein